MTFRNTAAAIVVLVASAVWAQSAPPAGNVASSRSRRVAANSNALAVAENQRAQSATHKRIEDMGSTLVRMHDLLKQMQAKTAKSSSKDPLIKANLEMWGLMLQDLDNQYEQLRLASHTREDIDARRAALYKQAEARAAMAAKNGQGVGAVPAAADQGAAPSSAAGTNAAAPAAAATQPAPATPPTQPAPANSSQN